jgi:hypothetical protein
LRGVVTGSELNVRKDTKAKSEIHFFVKETLHPMIRSSEIMRELWEKLE